MPPEQPKQNKHKDLAVTIGIAAIILALFSYVAVRLAG